MDAGLHAKAGRGAAASAGMELNWAPVSVWLSFTLPRFPRRPPTSRPSPLLLLQSPTPPPTSALQSFCPLATRPTPPSSSLVICGPARGIDWWSRPRVSPPSSYLLFSQTLAARRRPGGLAVTRAHACTHARQTSNVDALSHHSAHTRARASIATRAPNVHSCIIDSGAERKRDVATCANSFTQTQSAGSQRAGRSRSDSAFSPHSIISWPTGRVLTPRCSSEGPGIFGG